MTFEELFSVDRSNMFRLLKQFPDQVREAVAIGNSAGLRKRIRAVKQIVLTGMGGSAISGDLLAGHLADSLRVPLTVNRHYSLPKFVGKETLLIVSSYSGGTEETISAYKEGSRKGAQVLCITSGGRIGSMARAKRHMQITIPGGLPPRAALGYSFFPLLIGLSRFGLVPRKSKEIRETIQLLDERSSTYGNPDPSTNKALQVAENLRNRVGVLYAGTGMPGAVATRWRGQIAENAKAMAWTHVVPEMNHNEIVGWRIPQEQLKETAVLLLRDRGDHKRVQRRMDLTRGILADTSLHINEIWSEGTSPLARMFSLIYLGDWVSYYLAILHGIDPTPVITIDHLKAELAK
ncbi:MAG: bifunctional phosphoglucose/phosphomannose isomerase [Ignavibacteria bacterium]|nr:bifunctional phosphoglucose/phosphomannose isomerase [Ignavibacteria bacterium]